MHPFTLGSENNNIIPKYRTLYIEKLRIIWKKFIPDVVCTDDFLFIPDISTTLEMLYVYKKPEKEGVNFLLNEWRAYQKGEFDQMFSFSGSLIPGTTIRLTTQDANQNNRDTGGHPDHKKDGIGIGWGNVSESEWLDLYGETFALLRKVSPGFSMELDLMIRKIIPIGISVSSHNSASHSSCIGHLYMSYPIEVGNPAITVLEAIIHESNHNKLNLVMKHDRLLLNDKKELYYSPYRPDARHISGIYLGLHALAGVISVFTEGHSTGAFILNDLFLEKTIAYHMKNALSIRVLDKYLITTPLGKEVYEEMKQVHHESSVRIHNMRLPSDLLNRSKNWATNHFMDVQKNYPYLRY